MANLRAFHKGQEELQDRLKKLHEEKHLIVNLLEHLLSRMDAVVGRVAAISNINQFLGQFINATSTMEQVFHKLFKIHVLLTEETYVDTEHGVSHMAITYAIRQDVGSSASELSALPPNEGYHCLSLESAKRSPPSVESEPPTALPLNAEKTSRSAFSSVPAAETGHPSATAPPSSASTTPSRAQGVTTLPPTAPPCTSPKYSDFSKMPTKSLSAPLLATRPKDTSPHIPAMGAAISKSVETRALVSPHKASLVVPYQPDGTAHSSPVNTKKSVLPDLECGDTRSLDSCDSDEASGWAAVHKGSVPPGAPSLPLSVSKIHQPAPKCGSTRMSNTVTSIKLSEDGNAVSYTKATPEIEKRQDVPPPSLEAMGYMQNVVLSFYKSPSEFWLQLESSKATLESLLDSLHDHYSGQAPDPGFEAKVGTYCAAYYVEDGQWYRARVQQLMLDHAKVIYIDFGNSDRVELQSLRPLDKRFAALPAQAMCCSIKGLPEHHMRSVVAMRAFRDKISSSDKLRAIFHKRDEIMDRFIVDVLTISESHGMLNLSQHFLSMCPYEEPMPAACPQTIQIGAKPAVDDAVAPLACPLPVPRPPVSVPCPPVSVPPPIIPVKDTFEVMLSVVFSPAEFYGQVLTKNPAEHKLTMLQKQLNDYGGKSMAPSAGSVTIGSYWICSYAGDEENNWYRVRVGKPLQEREELTFRVFFVDYGNRSSAKLSELRPLPAELAKLPACAFRMALSYVGPKEGRWDKASSDVFLGQAGGFKNPLVAEKTRQYQERSETVLEVVLWNKSNPEVAVNLNIALVEQGAAVLKNENL